MEKPMSSLEAPLVTSSDDDDDDNNNREGLKVLLTSEVKKQLHLAGPLIVGSLMQNMIQMISLMFVGHLGELALSAAASAASFTAVTGFSLLMGMGSALDTLCGQSYGAKQYHMLGIHKQRAMLVLTLASFPLALLWAHAPRILVLCGQRPEIAEAAGKYARGLIPSLFAYGLLQCHVRFMHAQNIVLPIMLSSGLAVLVHVGACCVLVRGAGLGIEGAALGSSVSYWVHVSMLACYVRASGDCRRTWNGFSREALTDVLGFVKLAVPSAAMVCMEWSAFEILVLLSGLLPNPQLETSVLSISLSTSSLVFMVPFGLGAAVSIRVSNELGAGRPDAARITVYVGLFLALTEGLIVGLILILLRNIWGYAYSNEKEVVNYLAIMFPILAISVFLDAIQAMFSGVVRGCGRQKIGAFVNLGTYYMVGIPAAVLLAFTLHVGGMGLWMGIICGTFLQVLVFLIIILHTINWDREARKAQDRIFSSTIPIPTDMRI